jgi:hypothetical protein
MASQFRVENVVGQDEWQSNFGPMLGWKLICRDLSSDRSGPVEINSKPEYSYKPGDTFWAEHKGERNGAAKLKRVQPPPGFTFAPGRDSTMPPLPSGLPSAHKPPESGKIPYEKAAAVYKRIASDFDKEHGYEHQYATTLFLAWLNGKIADPLEEPTETSWSD